MMPPFLCMLVKTIAQYELVGEHGFAALVIVKGSKNKGASLLVSLTI
jgi:hypothetical protein